MPFETLQQLLRHSTDTFLVPTVISAQERCLWYFHWQFRVTERTGSTDLTWRNSQKWSISPSNSFLFEDENVLYWSFQTNEQMNHLGFLILHVWGWSLWLCISNELPGDADDTGLGTTGLMPDTHLSTEGCFQMSSSSWITWLTAHTALLASDSGPVCQVTRH